MNDAQSKTKSDSGIKTTLPDSAYSVAGPPPFPWKRVILAGFAFLGVSFITWVVVVAIQRQQDEPEVDPDQIKNVEVSQNETIDEGDDPFASWRDGDGELVSDAPFAIRYLHDHPREPSDHVLDPLLGLARDSLRQMRQDVRDYTATIIKLERIGGRLNDENYMDAKIRQAFPPKSNLVSVTDLPEDPPSDRPFAVYLRFLEPASARGREVIWIEGENDNKLIAHEGGLKNLLTVRLAPESRLAMLGNRYPITQIGIENLLVRFVEIGEKIKAAGDCEITLNHHVTVDDRPCTLIQLKQTEKREGQEFYRSEVYIDHELNLPIRYLAYDWPANEGEDPPLIESYTYKDLMLNVGLTDADFDPDNEAYRYH